VPNFFVREGIRVPAPDTKKKFCKKNGGERRSREKKTNRKPEVSKVFVPSKIPRGVEIKKCKGQNKLQNELKKKAKGASSLKSQTHGKKTPI